jgi:hypothetical protein
MQGYGVAVVGIERVKNLPMWQARPISSTRRKSTLVMNQSGVGGSGWVC